MGRDCPERLTILVLLSSLLCGRPWGFPSPSRVTRRKHLPTPVSRLEDPLQLSILVRNSVYPEWKSTTMQKNRCHSSSGLGLAADADPVCVPLDIGEGCWEVGLSCNAFERLSSRELTSLIRKLSDRSNYPAIARLMSATSEGQRTAAVFYTAIAALAKTQPADALEVFENMTMLQIQPSASTMGDVLTAVAHGFQNLTVTCCWQERLEECHPQAWSSSQSWDATIQSLCDLSDADTCQIAANLLDRMRKKGVEPTTQTFQNLLLVCASRRNVTMAEGFLSELTNGTYPGSLLTPRLWSTALQVFSLSGDHEGARKVLLVMKDKGQQPDVRHYTAYLKSLSPNTEQMLQVLRHMESLPQNHRNGLVGLSPDLVAVKTVLRACVMVKDAATAEELLGLVKAGELGQVELDEQCYNLALGAFDDPAAAKALIREMRLTRRYRFGVVPPSLVTYTQAVSVCKRASDLSSALLLLQQSKHDGLKPDVVLYTATIWTAAKCADLKCAKRLLNEMHRQCCRPNEVSYNGLIAACVSAARAQEAVDAYVEMIAQDIRPTAQTFSLLARSIWPVANLTQKVKLLNTVYHAMEHGERRVSVSGPILEAAITSLAASGHFHEALRVYDDIVGPRDELCRRAILLTCSICKPPKWEAAISILHSSDVCVGTTGPVYVDPLSLGYAMMACSKANKWEESLKLWRLYGSNRMTLPAVNSLIGACGRSGRPDIAMSVLNELSSFGVEPDDRTFRNAIVACNQAEHRKQLDLRRYPLGLSHDNRDNDGSFEWWECALSLIRRMKEVHGLKPDVQSYSSAISACEAAGQWQHALGLLQSLLDDRNTDEDTSSQHPNLYCFNAAISACAKAGAWIEAMEVYEMMKSWSGGYSGKRSLPNIVTLGSLIEGLDRAGQKELAQEIYYEGLRYKSIRPWRVSRSNTGKKPIWVMDLHSFTAAMARAAVRSQLETWILKRDGFKHKGDWVVVVGKGLRSDGQEPVLLPTVLHLLQSEYKLKPALDPQNSGRLIVPHAELQQFIDKHS